MIENIEKLVENLKANVLDHVPSGSDTNSVNSAFEDFMAKLTTPKDNEGIQLIDSIKDFSSSFSLFIGECKNLAEEVESQNPFRAESDGKRMRFLVQIAEVWYKSQISNFN